MYVDQNVAGQKAWLVFCLLPPHSADWTATSFCFPSNHGSNIVYCFFFFFYEAENTTKVLLLALAFTKCPSTESCLGSNIWLQCNTDKKMSLIMIWFHIIQIFVLFIYYIY